MCFDSFHSWVKPFLFSKKWDLIDSLTWVRLTLLLTWVSSLLEILFTSYMQPKVNISLFYLFYNIPMRTKARQDICLFLSLGWVAKVRWFTLHETCAYFGHSKANLVTFEGIISVQPGGFGCRHRIWSIGCVEWIIVVSL